MPHDPKPLTETKERSIIQTSSRDTTRLKEEVRRMNGQSFRVNDKFIEIVLDLCDRVEMLEKQSLRKVVKIQN